MSAQEPRKLTLVVNWFEELRQRMGNLKAQIPWLRVFVEGVVVAPGVGLKLAKELEG